MPESGSCMFTDADDYQASFGGALDLVVARPRHFQARLTWVKLPHLRLLRAEEALPRAAYVSVPAEPVFVSFPARRNSLLICDGASAQFGEVIMHRRGAPFHQRLVGPARWGLISLRPEHLSYFSVTIAERDLAVPQANQIFCPRPADRLRLLGLYARACRITETDLGRIAHPEVARALEQDLIHALISCLASAVPRDASTAQEWQSTTLSRFEEVLAANPHRSLGIATICTLVETSEASLQAICAQSLGMSPDEYQRLRLLKRIRAEIVRAHPAKLSFAELAARYGLTDLPRFSVEYLDAYGIPAPLRP